MVATNVAWRDDHHHPPGNHAPKGYRLGIFPSSGELIHGMELANQYVII